MVSVRNSLATLGQGTRGVAFWASWSVMVNVSAAGGNEGRTEETGLFPKETEWSSEVPPSDKTDALHGKAKNGFTDVCLPLLTRRVKLLACHKTLIVCIAVPMWGVTAQTRAAEKRYLWRHSVLTAGCRCRAPKSKISRRPHTVKQHQLA